MKKIPAKSIIEFRNKKDNPRITLVRNLSKEKKTKSENENNPGGDYWISVNSTLEKVFKFDDKEIINEKIEYLYQLAKDSELTQTKNRHLKNIELLSNFEDFDFNVLKPKDNLTILSQKKEQYVIDINGLPIYLKPSHVFTFKNKELKEVGAVWFIAQKGGYKKLELAMLCDILQRYLKIHYKDDFIISMKYCIVVDVFHSQSLSYEQIINEHIHSSLIETLDEFKKLL